MPATVPVSFQDPMVGAHEQRIQRLEVGFAEVQSTVEGMVVTVDHTQKTVGRVEEKVDGLDSKIVGLTNAIQATAQKAEQELQKIHQEDELEEAEHKARWVVPIAFAKKAAIPMAVVATAAATKLGEALWAWVTHLN